MPKGTSLAEVMALVVIKLCLSEGIGQSSQSISHYKISLVIFFKLHNNLLKAFRVDLKACLGLVLPNQYCFIIVRGKVRLILGWCFFKGHFWSLLHTV